KPRCEGGAHLRRSETAAATSKRSTSLRKAIRNVVFAWSRRFRAQRAKRFRAEFQLSKEARVLDLGGGDGEHIRMVLKGSHVPPENIYVADVNARALERAKTFGHPTALLSQDGKLPFPDGYFDVVFCSS